MKLRASLPVKVGHPKRTFHLLTIEVQGQTVSFSENNPHSWYASSFCPSCLVVARHRERNASERSWCDWRIASDLRHLSLLSEPMVVSGTWDSYNAADVRIPQRVDSKTHPLLISLMLKGGTREIDAHFRRGTVRTSKDISKKLQCNVGKSYHAEQLTYTGIHTWKKTTSPGKKLANKKHGILRLHPLSPTANKNVQRFRFRECNPRNLKSKFPPFFQQISSISKAPPLSLPRGGRWEHKNDPHKEGCAMQLTNLSQNAAVPGKGCPT